MIQKNIIPLVTSVGMDDYLEVTLRHNRALFERYYVLTSSADEKSIEICYRHGAEAILYKKFFENKECKFDKYGGQRYAQKILHELHSDKWILMCDTDIILPKDIASIEMSTLDKKNIYSVYRWNAEDCESYESGKMHQEKDVFSGYFHLYFDKSKYYETGFIHRDTWFKKSFPKMSVIEEIKAIHIGRTKMHWNGRSSSRLEWDC
jgi:hypothetical protein